MSAEEMYVILTNNQVSIRVVQGIQLGLMALWFALVFVRGFALNEGGGNSAVPHIPWMFVEVVTLYVGSRITGFVLTNPSHANRLELMFSDASGRLTGYMIMLGTAIVANIAHVVLSIIEVVHCTSAFCVSGYGFLIAFIIGLFAMILLELYLIWRVRVYQLNLIASVIDTPSVGDLERGGETYDSITTPLIDQTLRKKKSSKQRNV